jgi:hypothetical protein
MFAKRVSHLALPAAIMDAYLQLEVRRIASAFGPGINVKQTFDTLI